MPVTWYYRQGFFAGRPFLLCVSVTVLTSKALMFTWSRPEPPSPSSPRRPLGWEAATLESGPKMTQNRPSGTRPMKSISHWIEYSHRHTIVICQKSKQISRFYWPCFFVDRLVSSTGSHHHLNLQARTVSVTAPASRKTSAANSVSLRCPVWPFLNLSSQI